MKISLLSHSKYLTYQYIVKLKLCKGLTGLLDEVEEQLITFADKWRLKLQFTKTAPVQKLLAYA
jgi:hypothetical protein